MENDINKNLENEPEEEIKKLIEKKKDENEALQKILKALQPKVDKKDKK
ncbi:MAG: hypothetical protein JEZ03_12845 [Bacteroidales bacterium]|nr:hypothetical protein [Bacteroidales bacterium]